MRCEQYLKILSLFAFLFMATVGPTQATENRFQKANAAYSVGDYQLAIDTFESLAKDGVSAPLLYNLANSYAQADKTGMAILNYERALRLASGDSDIRGNMELLRREKGLFQEEQTATQLFVGFLGLNQWTILAVIGIVLFALFLLLPSSIRLKKRSRNATAIACLMVSISAVIGMYGQYLHYQDGVVVAMDARLRISPFESAVSTGTIQEGRLLTPLKTHNSYVLVKDETGRSGWLASDDFIQIASF